MTRGPPLPGLVTPLRPSEALGMCVAPPNQQVQGCVLPGLAAADPRSALGEVMH